MGVCALQTFFLVQTMHGRLNNYSRCQGRSHKGWASLFDSVGQRHNGHDDGHFSVQMASKRVQNRGKTALRAIFLPEIPFANRVLFCSEGGWVSMATARDRHYHTRSARLVTPLAVAVALPQPCHNRTLTHLLAVKVRVLGTASCSPIVWVLSCCASPLWCFCLGHASRRRGAVPQSHRRAL